MAGATIAEYSKKASDRARTRGPAAARIRGLPPSTVPGLYWVGRSLCRRTVAPGPGDLISGALEGISILDLSQDIAGAYACMLLGDMGAEVIRVEPPAGGPLRSEPAFQFLCRGRRSASIDVASAEGKEIVERLVSRSDVMVTTMLPREARRLGFDFGKVSERNPRLVYCSMSAFGDSGPLADLPGDDGVATALVGIYGDQGGSGQPPIYLRLRVASYGAAFLAAMATCSALYAREATGLGQRVDTPLYAGGLAMQAGQTVAGPNVWLWSKSITSQRGINPAYQLYECQDGWLFLACGNDVFWNKLCIALGIEHLVEDPRFENAPWNVPVEHRDDLVSIIGGILRERPRAHWLEFLAEHDVPTAPVMSREQFYEHPQVAHTQALTEVDDPALGPTRQMGMSVILHESPGSVGGPAPPAGRHTREVLYELGYGPEEVDRLSGLGVVRLTNGQGAA